MVSGLVTSPEDQSRICLDDASPIRMASKSLMSIKALLRPSLLVYFTIGQVFGQRPRLGIRLFLRVDRRPDLDVCQVAELLIGRQRQLLARLVEPLLALLGLLCGRLARRRPQRPRRQVDAELLGRA